MTKAERIKEITGSIKSFGKETYFRSEVLSELFSLQEELVNLTFNEEHAENSGLKLWDVGRHLAQVNEENGHVADEELQRFERGSRAVSNLICSLISGNRGENMVFRTLERLQSEHTILKNVELGDGDMRTELDAVVITAKGVFIIEVKNTKKDIFIDGEGGYYRTGEYTNFDCNIGEKMEIKESLLRAVLKKAGMKEIKIQSIVVFTNNRIEVRNRYDKLQVSFLGQLPYIIDEYSGWDTYSEADMHMMADAVEEAQIHEAYPMRDVDIAQFKMDFAILMATLEDAAQAKEVEEAAETITVTTVEQKEVNTSRRKRRAGLGDIFNRLFTPQKAGYAGTAAAVAMVMASTLITVKRSGI